MKEEMLGKMNNQGRKLIVAFLIMFTISSISAWTFDFPDPPITYGIYTEAEVVKILSKIFSDWQGDKSEKLVFITADGQTFIFGNGDPNGVFIKLSDIIRTLARKGYHLGTVTNIFHNHKWENDFTSTDIDLFNILKKVGFAGEFQLFYPETRRIKTLNKSSLFSTH